MPLRPPAGFIRPGFDPLKNPDAPTIGAVTAGDATASVSFTPPANVGGSAISAYYAVSNPGRVTVSAEASPITVTGLTNGTGYTFAVWALNTYGPGPFSAASGSVAPAATIGLFFGGTLFTAPGITDVITKITVSTTGNSTEFGNLNIPLYNLSGCASSTRAIVGGGQTNSGSNNVIRYIEFDSGGSTATFGNFSNANINLMGACNSPTRGVFAGGVSSGTIVSSISYITINSTGNATAFGNLTLSRYALSACSSSTRGIFIAGTDFEGNRTTNIDYITIATTGNAVSFGSTGLDATQGTSCSNSTRGVIAYGYTGAYSNALVYITIASTGNTTSFGSLTVRRNQLASASNATRGTFAAGYNSLANQYNTIDYVTLATTGDAVTFGELANTIAAPAGCSNGNGGLQ